MIETNLIEDLRLLSPPSYGWVVILALGLVTVSALVGLWWTKRRAAQPTTAVQPGPELGEDTLAALERLTALLRRECSREYGIQSTTILRRYLERRYGLHAPRLATEEFLLAARHSPALPSEHRASLGHFLELCDLFKFGRYLASAEELQQLQAAAVAFVLASRPSVSAESDSPGGPA